MALRVAVGGFGAIGKVVAAALDEGIDGLSLSAVSARDAKRAEAAVAEFATPVPVVPLDRLWQEADVVVECVPAKHLRAIAEPALANGRMLVTLSCGALLDNFDLTELARQHAGRILVPTGALIGLDAVQAAALGGGIRSVQMITRKPPNGLDGAPYLVEHGIDVTGLNAAKRVFVGNAREAARGFPANVNVAAALALAGIGPERTTIEIWADPEVSRNTHRIEVEADSARFSMRPLAIGT
jgi:aspartate dehydrogenase